MRREIKIERAKKLREEGLTYQAIATRLHLSRSQARFYSTVAKVLVSIPCASCRDPFTPSHGKQKYCSEECAEEAHNKQKHRCEEETGRTNCKECNAPLAAGSRWSSRSRLCASCRRSEEAQRLDSRARKIEAWWAEGLTQAQIAGRLGWTRNHVQVEMVRLREKGYELPYRRAVHPGGAPKHPEQVAA